MRTNHKEAVSGQSIRLAPTLTCRDTGLTDEDAAILMRNLRLAFIGQRDDQLAYQQARYQVRTRAWREARRG
jgi:hypothetical protein